MKSDSSNSKISLTECKKILGSNGSLYSDEEIIIIRDWMYHISDIAIDANEMDTTKTKE